MAKCPWFGTKVDPDPEDAGLGLGEVGTCMRCGMQYVVSSLEPYELQKHGHGAPKPPGPKPAAPPATLAPPVETPTPPAGAPAAKPKPASPAAPPSAANPPAKPKPPR